ncbi:Nif11-like leader peptide family natural product precursor [Spiribacter sp. C176]|uniref:Nif11-like leader peptide family natural product n=1 Tax=Spiribacter salilacus TaxID=2664894 RepID=A0A6N7QTW1_9GAMM|nr:Nif11-like leader peptide family natural product precursor [Spiribacter salilacus]MRH79010.1 Nif11-like leader peptide family natural product precursor [Spiribacter salilacus]
MSAAEIERFVSDLASNELLREKAVNASEGVESLVAIAQEHGYDITVDEAQQYVQANAQGELSDDQLDTVAGGKGGVGEFVLVTGGAPSASGPAAVEIVCAASVA